MTAHATVDPQNSVTESFNTTWGSRCVLKISSVEQEMYRTSKNLPVQNPK